MANIKVETKNNVNIKSKPRVYFTCHPEDFERYFKKICEDIFKTHDCAVYYTENMNEKIADEDKETDLNRNNLFVVPVTFRLLSTPNRAMDEDIPYAKEKHIPILPIMMESGIDAVYSRPDKFGELQYLNPNSSDLTEVSYEEKLKKYLESVLISDEMAKRVRAAFDAYIFLSYRKKDRRYANELMRLIHCYPECRDIAIWFDEFLTPGESFKENINKILSNSKLFTLLVTPNLLEENNFVMREEYPAAKNSGIDILPAEMESTNKAELLARYENLPECANPYNTEEFKSRLIQTITKLAISSNNNKPEHNFLIGLAYLDGIDVETNRERGIELITSAAEAGLIEAMEKLYKIYNEGIGANVNFSKALKWAEKIADYYIKQYGEENEETLGALNRLSTAYIYQGEYFKALKLSKKAYKLHCRILGEEHPETLTSLNNFAFSSGELGNCQKALELKEKIYELRCKVLGEEHPDTLSSLNNLAIAYGVLDDRKKELELCQKAYGMRCKILGEEHPDTLTSLSNLAFAYNALEEHQEALEIGEKAYNLRLKVLGEEHPRTLITLNNLSLVYEGLGEQKKALELKKKVYDLRRKVLGEEHNDTLSSLSNLVFYYKAVGDYKSALPLQQKLYYLRVKLLGEDNPKTQKTLECLNEIKAKLNL